MKVWQQVGLSALFFVMCITLSSAQEGHAPLIQSGPWNNGQQLCGDMPNTPIYTLTTFGFLGADQDTTRGNIIIGFSIAGSTIDWCPSMYQTVAAGRDPTLTKIDGNYYINYTQAPGTTYGCVSSPDVLNWSSETSIGTTGGGLSPTNVWAPTWWVDPDGSLHVFVAISEDGLVTFQIYEQTVTGVGDVCARTFSNPTLITITGETRPIDPWVMCIDGSGNLCTPISGGNTYYMFYIDGPGNLQIATSATLTGTYTNVKTGNWAGWGTDFEGEQPFYLGGGAWRMFMDKAAHNLTSGQLHYSDCASDCFGSGTWSTPIPVATGPIQAKHGSIYPYP